ncbi:polyprenyl diphosphate synthase [Streptomyces sp. WI04-05B]|uniref:polyprenyl diphosphate synthase n=1 Tax=Streptomyces TaxID=1883 RepID=UPI0029A2C8D3|nr:MULTISPECIES: polyprenyl diphosphate synthase [unclassified Streptomyces]MDX2544095.1 polyprenyl diphosphate synthase [Streptomyces sp. WI04-05B]MDX2584511.1 polyprenyl diphosphate synthase [Streptomyces sp. WI04-05A]
MTEPSVLTASVRPGVPAHVALVLDGNRRWAAQRGLGVDEGHRYGIGKIPDVLQWCEEEGVAMVTQWILSVRNLQRSPQELAGLYQSFTSLCERLAAAQRWRVRVIGDLELLPAPVAEAFEDVQRRTKQVEGMAANIAVAYDGRREIVSAARSLAQKYRDRWPEEPAEDLSWWEGEFASHLGTAGLADPDLVIRTSGEQRLSGYLTWQTAQSELYFCERLWPDFTREDLREALHSYASRQRRLGL